MAENEQHSTDTHNETDKATEVWIIVAVVAFLAVWGGCVAIWGIPGLYIPALMLVPVVWMLLILISRG